MKIDCISDLHGNYPKLKGGDLLLIGGDLTARDLPWQYMEFAHWLDKQKYCHKIFIAGNHDNYIKNLNNLLESISNTTYLCDSGTEFEDLKIWGSPWTKTFKGMNPICKAFTFDTERQLERKFSLIPRDVDILITHSPPYGILDKTIEGNSVGSKYLYSWLLNVGRPKLHMFGHIHHSYGQDEVFSRYDEFPV